MTILYRSPTVILDAHEWHVAVEKQAGRVTAIYRWRPLSLKEVAWRPLSMWKGARPKGLGNRFWRYRCHMREAIEAETMRQWACRKVA